MKVIFALLTLTFLLLLAPIPSHGQTAWVLDSVAGSFAPDTITGGVPVTFFLRMQNYNQWGAPLKGATSGFKIYTPNYIHWTPVHGYEVIDMEQYFDYINRVGHLGATGSGVDTVTLAYAKVSGPGLPADFDGVTHAITTGVDPAYHGRTLCIDSCAWDIPVGMWLWTYGAEFGSLRPDWDGPYCYTIDSSSCCQTRGNVDHDGAGSIDIADLVYLVLYMFQEGSPPPCPSEANCDGDPDDAIDIADLIHLALYMFQGGPAPVPCQ